MSAVPRERSRAAMDSGMGHTMKNWTIRGRIVSFAAILTLMVIMATVAHGRLCASKSSPAASRKTFCPG